MIAIFKISQNPPQQISRQFSNLKRLKIIFVQVQVTISADHQGGWLPGVELGNVRCVLTFLQRFAESFKEIQK